MSRRNQPGGRGAPRGRLYGNSNGLPGLPETRYMPLGGHPQRPPPPQRAPAPLHTAPPILSNLPPPPQPMIPQSDPMAARRIDMLEQRLNQTEQSNRTLLDELMRLQQDLKMNVKKNEMGISEEKEARGRLDGAVRQSQNKTYETEDRIRRCEDGIKDVRNAVQLMSGHTKSVEKAIGSFQQEQMERRSNSANRLQEYRHEVMKMNQSKEQLERLCFSLRDEMREALSRVDNMGQEMGSLESNVKLQARLMEDYNNKRNLAPKTPAVKVDNTENMTETVRMALEGKMIQINTSIQDLTHRQNLESKKREKLETDVNIRMNELLEDYGSTKVAKDKEMREFDEKMKELQAGFSVAEKQRIHMEISSVAKDLNRKIDEKEAKLRDDTVNKLSIIENSLVEENKSRGSRDKAMEDKVEQQIRYSKRYTDENTEALKKHVDTHANQVRDRMGEMTTNINHLEEQMREHKLEQEKVLASEIKERQGQQKVLKANIDDLEDRQKRGIATLQTAIGEQNRKNVPAPVEERRASPDYDESKRGLPLDETHRTAPRQPINKTPHYERPKVQVTRPPSDTQVLEQRKISITSVNPAISEYLITKPIRRPSRRPTATVPEPKPEPVRYDSNRSRVTSADLMEIERMQKESADGIRQQVQKDLHKVEKRVGDIETKVEQQEDRLDSRLKSAKAEDKEANSVMGDKLQQKIDSVEFSQERLKKQVDSLQDKVQDTPKGVTDLQEQMDEIDTKLRKKIDQERKERVDDVTEMKGDIDRIIGKNEPNAAAVPSLARLNQDFDETQTGLKKLGTALHVVKERFDTKIKDERKERSERDSTLSREIERTNSKYGELSERIKKLGKSS